MTITFAFQGLMQSGVNRHRNRRPHPRLSRRLKHQRHQNRRRRRWMNRPRTR